MSHQHRALLLPQEVKELGPEQAIVLYEGLRPIRCRKIRYFADRCFRKRLMPAPGSPVPFHRPTPSIPVSGECPKKNAAPDDPKLDVGKLSQPKAGKEDVVLRDATAQDIERIESLTLEDFATDFSSVKMPNGQGPMSAHEMQAAVETFLNSLERS